MEVWRGQGCGKVRVGFKRGRMGGVLGRGMMKGWMDEGEEYAAVRGGGVARNRSVGSSKS